MDNQYFNKALGNFIYDNASGGAIRHLFDLGYTIDEIAHRLDYPTPKPKIQEIVWEHMLNTGIISFDDPKSKERSERISYVEEYGKYGTKHFKRVSEKIDVAYNEYCLCDFGKQIYQNKEAFETKLEGLSAKDKEYIFGIPWPLQNVYCLMDERMKRIVEHINAGTKARS